MFGKTTLAALGCLALAAPAAADAPHVAVWSVASRWVCRADLYRRCSGISANCLVRPGTAVFAVDFTADTIRQIGPANGSPERIVLRRFEPYEALVGDIHVIVTEDASRSMSFGQPGLDEAGRTVVRAAFMDLSVRDVHTHFMRCESEPPVG